MNTCFLFSMPVCTVPKNPCPTTAPVEVREVNGDISGDVSDRSAVMLTVTGLNTNFHRLASKLNIGAFVVIANRGVGILILIVPHRVKTSLKQGHIRSFLEDTITYGNRRWR